MAKVTEKYKYKGISFARGYDKPFAEFKKEFSNLAVFKAVPHLERDNAMKSVHAEVLKHSKKQKEFDAEQEKKAKAEGSKNDKEDGNTKGAQTTGSKSE